jgi:DNA-binding CsgD family transcriptional regulator
MYAAAGGLRAEAMKAMRESRRALRHLADGDRWALHSSAYLAVGEVLLGREGRARRALADLRSAARRAGPRFAALVDAIAALRGRWSGEPLSAAALGVALERLEAHDFGGLARFLGALPLPSTDRARIGLLTPVEKEVLRHVAAGATSKEIAATLERSPQTIDVHIRSICKKLGCSGRRQAVAFAIREGLIDELPAL